MTKKVTKPDLYDLNLPSEPNFLSTPPNLSIDQLIALAEEMLPYWNEKRFANMPPLIEFEPFRLLED